MSNIPQDNSSSATLSETKAVAKSGLAGACIEPSLCQKALSLIFERLPDGGMPECLESKEGKWSVKENAYFNHALGIFGTNWPAIQQVVKTRSGVQIRSHAQKHFIKEQRRSRRTQAKGSKGGAQKFCVIKGIGSGDNRKPLAPEEEALVDIYFKIKSFQSFIEEKKKVVVLPSVDEFVLPPLGLVSEGLLEQIRTKPSFVLDSFDPPGRLPRIHFDELQAKMNNSDLFSLDEEFSLANEKMDPTIANMWENSIKEPNEYCPSKTEYRGMLNDINPI